MTTRAAPFAGASVLSTRLEGAAFALLALLPLGMAIANKSAPPILVAAALAAMAGRLAAGQAGALIERLAAGLRGPIGLGCLLFLLLAAVSIGWSHHTATSWRAYGELVLAAGSALVLHAALPRPVPDWAVKLAVIALALGCLSVTAELATGMAVRAGLGIRSYPFIFKRSVAAILMVLGPVAAFVWLRRGAVLAVALGILFAIACLAAQSSATLVALVVGLVAAACAALWRRGTARLLAAGLVVALLVAPVLGEAVDRLMPQSLVDRLAFTHADQRIAVWRSFGEVVKRRPVLGAGFGTSSVIREEPVAAEVPPERREMLGAWHPHNGYLQVWSETGLIGAALFAVPLVLSVLSIGQAGALRAAAGAGLVAAAGFIMLVGHGIWQGWWSATVGAALIWLARLPDGRIPTTPPQTRP